MFSGVLGISGVFPEKLHSSSPLKECFQFYIPSNNCFSFLCNCLCLFIEFSSARRVSNKLMKVLIFLLRKHFIRTMTYLNDMVLMVAPREELLVSWDIAIYLLKNLGFLIKLQKSILNAISNWKFPGVFLGSQEFLPTEKITKI